MDASCPTPCKEILQLGRDMAAVKRALLGDDFTETPGMIHQVKDHEERLGRIEWTAKKALYIIIGSGLSGSGITLAAVKLLHLL